MKLAAIAKLIKADGYCKLYKVFYDDCRTYDLYIGTKTAIFPLTGFPKAQNESELATLLGISKKEWADIEFDNDCPDDLHHIEGMDLDDTADGEMDCVTGRIGIRYCGCELVPMIEPVSGTVGFVDAKQIMPVADEIRKSGYFKYGIFEVRIGLLTLRGYGKYWRLIPKVDAPWWLATPYGTPNCSPNTVSNGSVWLVGTDGSGNGGWYYDSCGVRPVLCFSSALLVSVEDEREAGFSLSDVPMDDLLAEIKSRTEG